MKFISTWTFPTGLIGEARKKFLETGGKPPEGIKLLGRWHGMDGRGFAISEATDAKLMFEWYDQWSDVLELKITPCVEDAELGAVLASRR
jgi:hypothetical protein